jgi:hypothetical protein
MLSLALLLSIDATAEPMDLLDPTPRPVEVAFEVSPHEKPTQTDTVYTPHLVAYFEPAEVPGQIRITVDRRDVERVLLAGHVKELDWGLFRSNAEAYIELDLVTQRVGGVGKPRHWLGQTLFGYCDDPAQRSCEIVPGRSYDSESGYVYAVGAFQVHFGKVTLPTFAPLGEAIFSEMEGTGMRRAIRAAHEELEQPATAVLNSASLGGAQSQGALPPVSAGALSH